jgi:triosephosphate isomerase
MESKHTWLVANWKMHGNVARVRNYSSALSTLLIAAPEYLKVVYCPPVIYALTAKQSLPENTHVSLGAQNAAAKAEGAVTGEVSAAMLADAGISYVILGHSECRARGETDGEVAAKAEAAIASGLIPILCVGESEEVYRGGKTNDMLSAQLQSFKALPCEAYVIAYEPIWAIGTGKTPNMSEIRAAHSHIKSVLGSETAVLYGGSVNAANAHEILALAEVSGALIGGASLEIESMRTIIAAACGSR